MKILKQAVKNEVVAALADAGAEVALLDVDGEHAQAAAD